VKGMWTVEEYHLSINILEMKAVILGVQAFQSTLRGKCIALFSDGRRVYSETGGDTFGHFVPSDVGPLSALLPSGDLADSASHPRETEHPSGCSLPGRPSPWTLHRDIVRTLVGMWDAPTVDLFTTRLNKRLPLFYSPLPDEEALGVDSLSAS
jgi:hypothetical protein